MRQLAGHTKAELVWVWMKSENSWRPTPISPRRYQPPQQSSTGACTRGGIIGGARGARSAANAPGIMTNAAAPASTKLFTLPMASSFLQQGTPGDGPHKPESEADDGPKSLSAT